MDKKFSVNDMISMENKLALNGVTVKGAIKNTNEHGDRLIPFTSFADTQKEAKYMLIAYIMDYDKILARLKKYDKSNPKEDEIKLLSSLQKEYGQTEDVVIERIMQVRALDKAGYKKPRKKHKLPEDMHDPCAMCYSRGHLYSPNNSRCKKCKYSISIEVLKHILYFYDGCSLCKNRKNIGGGYWDCKTERADTCHGKDMRIDWNEVIKDYQINTE